MSVYRTIGPTLVIIIIITVVRKQLICYESRVRTSRPVTYFDCDSVIKSLSL